MAVPRLRGSALAAAVRASETAPLRPILWRQMARDFGIPAIEKIPPELLPNPDVLPKPIRGAPPRRWEDKHHHLPHSDHATGCRIREAYASGALSPREVLETIARAIHKGDFGEAQNTPFVTLDLERARGAAVGSSDRYRAKSPLGKLDGIPIAVKDQHDMDGLPTRGGTRYSAPIAQSDSEMVARLRAAGALLYAKTIPTEWGLDPCGRNSAFPMPRNTYRRDRAAGGSSTGSAVCVALGFAPAATGTDGGGSVRIPPSLNGLFGIKPTYARVSVRGDRWHPSTMGHTGAVGTSTEDAVELLGVIAGNDPGDPLTAFADGEPGVEAWRAALRRGVKGARIGILRSELESADPPIAARCMEALHVLEKEGARLSDAEIPLIAHAPAVGALTIAIETLSNLLPDYALHKEQMGDDLRLFLSVLHACTAAELGHAARVRAGLRREAARVLSDLDLLALPTTATPALPYPAEETGVAVSDPEGIKRMTRFAFFANLTGLPAGTAPCGMVEGLPIGLQLVGDAWDEASVFAAMAHAERTGLTRLPRPAGFLDVLG